MNQPDPEVETTPAEVNPLAAAAIIEVVEQHKGPDRQPTFGSGSIIVPNHVRINGVAVHCTEDDPVVVQALHLDGTCKLPFVATLSLMARAIRIGDIPVSVGGPAAAPDDQDRGAVLEIPIVDLAGRVRPRPGQLLDPPVVYLNGSALYTSGSVKIERLRSPWDHQGPWVATVLVPLLCRRFLVDDEVKPPPVVQASEGQPTAAGAPA